MTNSSTLSVPHWDTCQVSTHSPDKTEIKVKMQYTHCGAVIMSAVFFTHTHILLSLLLKLSDGNTRCVQP